VYEIDAGPQISDDKLVNQMNKQVRYIIAVDPDTEKSGVAIVDRYERKLISVTTMTFAQILRYLVSDEQVLSEQSVLVLEASWRISHNWHTRRYDNASVAAAKGYAVGRNHQIGYCIAAVAAQLGISVEEQTPLRKCWQGMDRKITHRELSCFTNLNSLKKRTNQEERDAVLLAWVVADLPINSLGKPYGNSQKSRISGKST
jgi:hypothetical protein